MSEASRKNRVIIREWPKMIFLWPTALVSLLAALVEIFVPEWGNVAGGVFLTCFAFNLVVLTFDFPRSTSLTVFIGIVSLILALVLLNQNYGIIAPLQAWLGSLNVNATRDFYITIFTCMAVLFVGMAVSTRFDYWELHSNELIHHSGLLGDVERFSTAGLKLNTEVNDIFEYLLAGSGRIIMNIPGNARPVVLDNVLNISSLLASTNAMLSHRVVEVAQAPTQEPDERARTAAEYE